MLDLTPIASAVKAVASTPPQAQPAVAEETKSVPGTETPQAVPPPAPGKGSEPGLGEHVDLYDTEKAVEPPVVKPKTAKKQKEEEEEAQQAEAKDSPNLLGKGTGLPIPTTHPAPLSLPFLKPLGHPLG